MTKLEQANNKDIVQVMLSYGLKKKGNGRRWVHFYSPFHGDTNPSIVVDVPRNKWKDYGASQLTKNLFGSVVDFVCFMDKCSPSEAISIILNQEIKKVFIKQEYKPGIIVESEGPITSKRIIKYVEEERKISIDLCRIYCKQVEFRYPESKSPDKLYTTMGFKNVGGGWELRSHSIKKSVSPKKPTLIAGINDNVGIFEGFINFLTCLMYYQVDRLKSSVLVLNGVGNRAYTDQMVMSFDYMFDFLDNDNAGGETSDYYRDLGVNIINCRFPYRNYNDFNAYWTNKK